MMTDIDCPLKLSSIAYVDGDDDSPSKPQIVRRGAGEEDEKGYVATETGLREGPWGPVGKGQGETGLGFNV